MQEERVNARASTARARNKFHCGPVTLFIVTVFGASLAFADAEKTVFNIEAQLAKTSLTLYARQAKVQLGFAADIVDDILTNPVKGEYENAQALELLLKGTGLEAEHGESGIVIRRVPKPTLTSRIEGPAPNTSEINNRLQLTPTIAQAPTLQPDNANEEEYEKAIRTQEEIVVTGSRIRGAQNASPVVTFTSQEIDRAGFATVEDLLEKLPQNFGGGASLDTLTDFANSDNVVGGFVDNRAGGTSVNLRGLGASSTLILLNGRRMSPSGLTARFTNISSIPVTAIERVDVLTDGASAIYGSDAIGGVINFILREDYEGAETRLRYGTDGRGDTSNVLLGQSLGKSWGDGNFLLTYEYYDSDNLLNKDRDITSTNDLSRFGGTDWRTPGGNPANINAGGQLWAIPSGQDGTSLTDADFDASAPANLHNVRSIDDVLPALERNSALLHLTQTVGLVQLFAEAQYSSQETERRNTGTFDFDVPNTNPFFVDPTGTGLTTVRIDNYFFEDIPGISLGEIDSFGAAFGVRFDIRENWNGELAGNWSKEEATARIIQTVDQDALSAALNQTDPNLAFNPFGDGSITNLAVFESLRDRTPSAGTESENELWSVTLNVDGEAFDISGGAVQVATGVEFREESLVSLSDRGPPPVISDSSREILAVYAEFFFPLVGSANRDKGLQRLELSVAGRYEDYSDFGDTINPKVGLVWSPTQALTLRGTYGTSFRAPALRDLDDIRPGTNRSTYIPDVFVPPLPFPIIVRSGGNADLRPEEATTWTAGFQWNPDRLMGLSLDATYFNVNFEDRIDLPTSDIAAAATDPRFRSIFNTNPTPEQIAALVNDPRWEETFSGFLFTPAEDVLSGVAPVGGILDLRRNNLSQSVVTGVELQLSYDFTTPLGSFDMGLSGNYLFDFKRRFIAADQLVEEVDIFGRPVDFRARGSTTWKHEEWSVSGFVNYTDGYTDNVSDPARAVDSWTTVDLTIAYDTTENSGLLSSTRLALTIQNLFDDDPPFVNTVGGLAYDSVNGNPMGRFLALQVTKEW